MIAQWKETFHTPENGEKAHFDNPSRAGQFQ
jgi:hypothetical protein